MLEYLDGLIAVLVRIFLFVWILFIAVVFSPPTLPPTTKATSVINITCNCCKDCCKKDQ